MNADTRFYFSIFLSRLPIFLLVSTTIAALGILLAISLPTVYTSSAKLLVEPPQIPTVLARTTVETNASEQLQVLQQKLMTRATLIDIAREYKVFEDIADISPDEIVSRMRTKTTIRSTSGRNKATLLEVAFDGRTAGIAARVVNDYVTRILNTNAQLRTETAGDTLDFFEQEVERLSTDLEVISAKIVAFQNENSDALPDDQGYRLSRQASLQERLAQIQRDRAALADQRARLIEVFETTGQVQSNSRRPRTPEEQQLNDAQDELASALIIYSEENPRVKVLRAKIAQLEKIVSAQAGSVVTDNGTAQTALDIQLAEIDSKLKSLDQQETQIEEELVELSDAIKRTPANAIALQALQREYQNVQLQHSNALAALSQAATGERIELTAKGQRIAVIEQANTPNEPTSPNRPLIAAGGILGGIAAGLGLIFLMELMNKTVRRPVELTNKLGITPIATVPYIRTKGEKVKRRGVQFFFLIALLIGIPAVLFAIHQFYLPLDLIWERLMDKMSFN